MPWQPVPRGFAARLAVIVAVGAAWRLARLVLVKWDQPLLLNDSLYYSAQARQLAEGRWFREIFVDHPGAEHGPLTAIVLAPLSWMGDPVPWQRFGTVALGVAVVALVGLLGRRVAGPVVGLVAAGLAAVYPNLWMNDGLVMSESLATLLVVAALLVLIELRDRVTAGGPVPLRAAALYGLVVGLAALTRSELALFVPLAWVVLWRAARPGRLGVRPLVGTAGTVAVAAMLTVAPWTAFNLVRFERPVLLTTNDGTTLLGAYCDDTFSGAHRGGWFIGCVVEHPTWDPDLEPSVRSGRQRSAAVSYARGHVAELPGVAVRRVARTFDLYAVDDLIAQAVGEEREAWAARAGIASFWLLAPLAAVGALRVRRPVLDVLALPVVTTVVVSAAFYGAHRFRTPMEPVVVVLAAVTLVGLWEQTRPRAPAAARDRAVAPAGGPTRAAP